MLARFKKYIYDANKYKEFKAIVVLATISFLLAIYFPVNYFINFSSSSVLGASTNDQTGVESNPNFLENLKSLENTVSGYDQNGKLQNSKALFIYKADPELYLSLKSQNRIENPEVVDKQGSSFFAHLRHEYNDNIITPHHDITLTNGKIINQCETVSSSGNYKLNSNLYDYSESNYNINGACLNFKSPKNRKINFTLDCKGHSINSKRDFHMAVYIKDAASFTLNNCSLYSIANNYNSYNYNTNQTTYLPAESIIFEKSTNGYIKNNTFNAYGLVVVSRSNHLKFTYNKIYSEYDQYDSSYITISKNLFKLSAKMGESYDANILVSFYEPDGTPGLHYEKIPDKYGNNVFVNNTLEGGSNGVFSIKDKKEQGADDGIVTEDYGGKIANNKISNDFDAGIETLGNIHDMVISGNTITNTGMTALGSYYDTQWQRNKVLNNKASKVPTLYFFSRNDSLYKGENGVYFKDNVFSQDSQSNAKLGVINSINIGKNQSILVGFKNSFVPDLSAILDFATLFPNYQSGKVKPGQIHATNNSFDHNKFDTSQFGPFMGPKGFAVDKHSNICTYTKIPAYHTQLSCVLASCEKVASNICTPIGTSCRRKNSSLFCPSGFHCCSK